MVVTGVALQNKSGHLTVQDMQEPATVRMLFKLISLTATICLLSDLSTLAANNTTTEELARSESLGSVEAAYRQTQLGEINITTYSKPDGGQVLAFTNETVAVTGDRKPQVQNSSIYWRQNMFVRNKTSQYSIPQLGITSSLQSHFAKMYTPVISAKEKLGHQERHVHRRASKVKSISSWYPHDDDMNNESDTAEGEQHNKPSTPEASVVRKKTVDSAPDGSADPSIQDGSADPSIPVESAYSYIIMNLLFNLYSTEKTRVTRNGVKYSCESTKCDYSFCNLTSVPLDLNFKITELLLNNNVISIIRTKGFSHYTFLEKLVLSSNRIIILEDDAFYGLSRLTLLDLANNSLGTHGNFSDRIFQPLISLKVLLMDGINWHAPLPDAGVFLAYLHNLEELVTDYNNGTEFGPGFRNLTLLRNLTLSCHLFPPPSSRQTFTNLEQITHLKILLSDTRGTRIQTGTFSHLKNLTSLDISDNSFTKDGLQVILLDLKESSLQSLRMDNCVPVSHIDSSITQYLPRTLKKLSARDNKIIHINWEGFMKLPKSLQFIDLSDSYIDFDDINFPLYVLEELETLLINSNAKACLIDDQYSTSIILRYESDFRKNRLAMVRNKSKNRNANIFDNTSWNSLSGKLKHIQLNVNNIDIFYMAYEFYIDNIENNIEIVDLKCSVLAVFDFTYVIYFPKVWFINIGRSSLRKLIIHQDLILPQINVLILESNNLNNYLNEISAPFKNLPNIAFLDLSLNQIDNLQTNLFYGLDNLEELRLDGNIFSRFDVNISNLGQLTLLNLSKTELPNLPLEVRSHIDHLCQARPNKITVDMAGCPIQCDCFNLDFLKWMVKSPAFDKNFTGYKCRSQDTSVTYILDGYEATIRDLDRQCAKNYPLFLVIMAATLILFCVVMGAVIYRFRWKIRYLYYAAYIKVTDKKKKDKMHQFVYDVFISYDSQDVRFVSQCLAHELENRDLKLLIHSRDFVAGTYIASNIVMAVAESRKTLVVLTRNLLESTWCNYEIQMATMEAVHTGRPVLVFLLKENIPNRELDVELLRYIKSNTYLPYPGPEEEGDEEIMKKFYDKLGHDLKC
ncbi:hypothetical protein BsWGS_03837 [Bradybaena similaris]